MRTTDASRTMQMTAEMKAEVAEALANSPTACKTQKKPTSATEGLVSHLKSRLALHKAPDTLEIRDATIRRPPYI